MGEYEALQSDRFGIDFPDDAGGAIKAVLVNACFLIDFLYFEDDEREKEDNMMKTDRIQEKRQAERF